MKRLILLGFIITLAAGCANQQLNKGLNAYDEMAYASAIDHLNQALEKDSTNAEAKIALANAYRLTNDYENAEELYGEVIQLPESKPQHKLQYARILMSANKHNEAANMIRLYQKDQPEDEVARALLEACNYIELFKEDTAAYQLREIPMFSNASMMAPVVYGQGIAYAAERVSGGKTNPWTGFTYYDVYTTFKENDEWQPQSEFAGKVTGQFHEGPISFNKAQDFAIITRSNYKSGKKLETNSEDVSHFGLFETRLVDGSWTNPKPLPFNSNQYSVGHGSLSADGKTLYFTSDMAGGQGGSDLYITTATTDGWSEPVNLGPTVNTPGNEVFPVYQNDSILYFSSDGQPSLGGLDLFKTERENDKWGTPKNMNFPINSTADDFSILFEKGDTTGFLSSNRKGNDRIFTFVKTPPVMLLSGNAKDKNTGDPISGITVKLINKTDGTEKVIETGSDGAFKFNLKPNKDYRIEGSKEGFFTQSHEFSTKDREQSEKIDWAFEMDQVEIGGDPPRFYSVENIFYDYDEWQIRPDAKKELNKLATLLKDNPKVVIELHSHTDSRAGNTYNDALSEKRAKAAVDYLVSQGIAKQRLQYKGFGERRLLNHCSDNVECSEEEHQENRRTEFVVLSAGE